MNLGENVNAKYTRQLVPIKLNLTLIQRYRALLNFHCSIYNSAAIAHRVSRILKRATIRPQSVDARQVKLDQITNSRATTRREIPLACKCSVERVHKRSN